MSCYLRALAQSRPAWAPSCFSSASLSAVADAVSVAAVVVAFALSCCWRRPTLLQGGRFFLFARFFLVSRFGGLEAPRFVPPRGLVGVPSIAVDSALLLAGVKGLDACWAL